MNVFVFFSDIRTQQQRAATSHFLEQLELTNTKPQTRTQDGQRLGDGRERKGGSRVE